MPYLNLGQKDKGYYPPRVFNFIDKQLKFKGGHKGKTKYTGKTKYVIFKHKLLVLICCCCNARWCLRVL